MDVEPLDASATTVVGCTCPEATACATMQVAIRWRVCPYRLVAEEDLGQLLREVTLRPLRDPHRERRGDSPVRLALWPAADLRTRLARHERLATAIAADLAHVLADRLERRTQDIADLLDAAGRHLPLSELERLRRRAVE